MKKLNGLLIIITLILFTSCNPKITTSISRNYPPLDSKQEVVVIGLDQAEPNNSEILGYVEIGDAGLSIKCGYDIVIDIAKLEARKLGGNALKIIEHKLPTFTRSSCHRIKATILKVENIENFTPQVVEESLLAEDYAILHVNRDRKPGQYSIDKLKYDYQSYKYSPNDKYNPTSAGIASYFLPGLGQMNCGEYIRGMKFMGGFLGSFSIAATGTIIVFPEMIAGNAPSALGISCLITGMLGGVGIMTWSIVDAIHVAKVKNLVLRDKILTGYILKIQPYTIETNDAKINFGATFRLTF